MCDVFFAILNQENNYFVLVDVSKVLSENVDIS